MFTIWLCRGNTKKRMVTSRQKKAREDFEKMANIRGYTIAGKYTFSYTKVMLICPRKHPFEMRPTEFNKGSGCKYCVNEKRIQKTKVRFLKALAELGGKMIGSYVNASTRVDCVCPEDHPCSVEPHWVLRGGGMCKTCAGKDSEAAKQTFLDRAKEAGVILEGDYVNISTPVKARCRYNHECFPTPSYVRQGGGFCKVCAGKDFATVKKNFIEHMIVRGFILLEDYASCRIRVHCKCPKGHDCYPFPYYIYTGRNLCIQCSPSSKGEEKVQSALCLLNINFQREFSFPGERYRYDFILSEKKIIIETDGQQHFIKIPYYNPSPNALILSQLTDVLKMVNARNEGYKILRIDYKWYDKPLEDFVELISDYLKKDYDSLPNYTYSNASMYEWVEDLITTSSE